jgi:hypothetical protein
MQLVREEEEKEPLLLTPCVFRLGARGGCCSMANTQAEMRRTPAKTPYSRPAKTPYCRWPRTAKTIFIVCTNTKGGRA